MGIPGEGVTDTDCGTQHFDCPTDYGSGMVCLQFGGGQTGLPAYHGCGCTDTSCAGNTDGTTVCDANLGFCRLPQDYEAPAVDGGVCAPGYVVAQFTDGSTGCLQACPADGGACGQSWTHCDTTDGVCVENDCTNFYGACATDTGASGGTCLPLSDGDGGYFGICEVNGSSTDACGGFYGDALDACAQNDICLSTTAGAGQDFPVATCFATCTVEAGCANPADTCLPLFGAGDSGFTPGYCVGTSGGDTFGACGNDYEVCRYGEGCFQFTSDAGIPPYFACACDATAGQDSCEETNDYYGSGGNVVCDSNTLRCRQPRDLEPWFGNAPTFAGTCADGYVGQDFGPLPNDAGEDVLCVQDCSAGQSCNATWAACDTTPSSFFEYDGGAGFGCYANLCGALADGGFDITQSWAGCDAGGAAGTCQPLPSTSGDYVGYCLRTGSASQGDACDGFLGDVNKAENCRSSEMCLPTGVVPGASYVDGGAVPIATCQYTCNAGSAGPAHNSACSRSACIAYTGDPDAGEQAGFCP